MEQVVVIVVIVVVVAVVVVVVIILVIMRFKATLTSDQVAIFASIVKELENVGSRAALYLCDEGMYAHLKLSISLLSLISLKVLDLL